MTSKAKKKRLVYSTDAGYFELARASLASFTKYHDMSEWAVTFLTVDLPDRMLAELRRYGEVREYPASPTYRPDHVVYPTAFARLAMMEEVIGDDEVMLYLDADTLVYDRLDDLVARFEQTGRPFGMAVEAGEDFPYTPASYCWHGHDIPEEFSNRRWWKRLPMCNTGVLLATGPTARLVGREATAVWRRNPTKVMLGEQTAVVSVVYDRDVPFMILPAAYNCIVAECHIDHHGTWEPFPYLSTVPYYRGERVAVRHFCGGKPECKAMLWRVLKRLDTDAQLEKFVSAKQRQ
jgi:lipopolysaccharide biosynthesis glycosyltransferase